jgi:hypothetical protein
MLAVFPSCREPKSHLNITAFAKSKTAVSFRMTVNPKIYIPKQYAAASLSRNADITAPCVPFLFLLL